MANETLKRGIDLEMCEQLRLANDYTTKHTVQLRVLKNVTDYMELPWSTIPDAKTTIRLTDKLRENIRSACPNTDDELEKVLAKDYAKPSEVMRILVKCSKQPERVEKIVAMDGFAGFGDAKKYVDHLKLATQEDFRGAHIRAVYELYEHVSDPQTVHRVITCAFGWSLCGTTQDEELKQIYTSCVGPHLDEIVDWKRKETQKRKSLDTSPPPAAKRIRKSKNPQRVIEESDESTETV